MIRVDVDYLKYLFDNINEINKVPFNEIDWIENGEIVEIDPKLKDTWKYIGLNNTDFIRYGYYKDGIIEKVS